MKKVVLLMLIGLMMLNSCDSEEPKPRVFYETEIYLAVESYDSFLIYNIDGDTIYESDDRFGPLLLEVDGQDWYAVVDHYVDELWNSDYRAVMKNGVVIYTTSDDELITDISIENGIVYTLHRNRQNNHQRVCKDFKTIYDVDEDYFSSPMVVQNGNITLAPSMSPTPCYWYNGQLVELPGLEGELDACCIDKDGDDVVLSLDGYYWSGYWRNGEIYVLPINHFYTSDIKLINGKLYQVGDHYTTSDTNTEMVSKPVAFIDGKEQAITGIPQGRALKLLAHGNDVYLQVVGGKDRYTSFIYKNFIPMKMGYVKFTDEREKRIYGDSANLSQLYIVDFAVIDKQVW